MNQNDANMVVCSFKHDSTGGNYLQGFSGKRHLTEGSTEEAKT